MTGKTGDGRSVVPALHAGAFFDHLVVDCPACGGKAVITLTEAVEHPREAAPAARRMLCHACGAVREQHRTPHGVLIDEFMGLPPRLRAVTRHGDLVARNRAHLDYLEAYLSGRLRVELVVADGVRNASVASRLPAWAKSAKNRDDILKAIARVRRDKL